MRKPGINLTLGVVLLVVAFGISAPALWGLAQLVKEEEVAQADNGGAAGGGGATGGPVQITIVAENIRFDLSTITVSPGVEVTITLDNRDVGVPHNVAFYTNPSAQSPIFIGDLTTGPSVDDFVFTSPSTPGNYYFQCDVHPQMNGAFVVQ